MIGQMPEKLSAEDLHGFAAKVLERCGLPSDDAVVAATALVEANLRGVDTHGIRLLPIYVRRLRLGLMEPRPRIEVIRETTSILLIDGGNGLGQAVSTRAMELCLAKAKRIDGPAAAGVRNSNHFGAAARYVLMAVQEDMIGVATTNGSAVMAPWGGAEPYFGANPVAVGIPAGQERPVVLDMATSVSARARIRLAAQRGEPIPEGWALDSHGAPTTDPVAAMAGMLLPVGGAKGYGLALTFEVISAVLTGAGFGRQTAGLYENLTRPQGIGHFFAALPVGSFLPVDEFKGRMDQLIRELKAIKPAQGVAEVLIPGEIEERTRGERLRHGIPIAADILRELRSLGNELGVML
ncbi:MAG: Ldh family oxidoreductase [Chloroflexi bacterium]|nr:Ldh family oxidoreductase [Chloroflexota bacterium]